MACMYQSTCSLGGGGGGGGGGATTELNLKNDVSIFIPGMDSSLKVSWI